MKRYFHSSTVIVFIAIMGLADVLLATWWVGSVWGMAVSAGCPLALFVSVVWTLRRRHA